MCRDRQTSAAKKREGVGKKELAGVSGQVRQEKAGKIRQVLVYETERGYCANGILSYAARRVEPLISCVGSMLKILVAGTVSSSVHQHLDSQCPSDLYLHV